MTTSREPYRPFLTTDADVTTMWRTIINPLGWHTRRIYFLLVDPEGRPHPQVIEVDDLPATFGTEDATRFIGFLSHLVGGRDGEAGSAALLFARPGGGTLSEGDRTLCRELYAAARAADVRLELLHVGTDTALIPVPMDEVLPRTA
jgi:hypothetical protein